MPTLNDLVNLGREFASPAGTEYCLDDLMPDIYGYDTLIGGMDHLSGILSRLFNEVRNYYCGRCRVTTKFVDGVQYVHIDHNGFPKEAEILELNSELARIGKGETWSGGKSGNKMAAESLKKTYSGFLSIEVLRDEEPYHVRTTISIPINIIPE